MYISASDLAARIVRDVQEAVARKTRAVTDGLPDFAEYREAVGYLRHAEEVLSLLAELTKSRGELS
jgi:hypothetical protein